MGTEGFGLARCQPALISPTLMKARQADKSRQDESARGRANQQREQHDTRRGERAGEETDETESTDRQDGESWYLAGAS